MKAKAAALQGTLAVVSLLAAYFTWQRGPEAVKGEVTVWDVSKNRLERVRYQDGPAWMEIWREEGTLWLRQGKDEVATKQEANDGGMPMVAEAPKPPRTVRASERTEKIWEKFAPFRAPRGFGVLPAEKLKELAIEGSTRKLEVFAEGSKKAFVVANNFASPFAKDETDGQVYLLSSAALADLSPQSQQLWDRRLHAFKAGEFDSFVVSLGNEKKEFLVSGALGDKVSPKNQPEKNDEYARNWHDRVWNKLLVGELFGKGELPPGGAPQVTVRIEYFQRGTSKGFLELGTSADGKQVFARSEFSASWVTVPQGGQEVMSESKRLVSGS